MSNKQIAQGQQLLEALLGLGKVANTPVKKVGEAGANLGDKFGKMLIGLIQQGGTVLGEASVAPARADLAEATKGTRTQQPLSVEPTIEAQINKKVRNKLISDEVNSLTEQARMGRASGQSLEDTFGTLDQLVPIAGSVPSEGIGMVPSNDLGIAFGRQASGQAQSGGQFPQAQGGQAEQQASQPNILMKILQGFAEGAGNPARQASANVELTRAQTDLANQELAQGGKLGIEQRKQQYDQVKKLESQRDDFIKRVNSPTTAEASKSVNFFTEAGNAASQLIQLIGADPNILNASSIPGVKKGQKIKQLIDKITSNLAPARGGQALSESELKLVKDLIPERGIMALFEDNDVAMSKLKDIVSLSQRTISRLSPDQKILDLHQNLKSQGFSDSEIFDALKSLGRI